MTRTVLLGEVVDHFKGLAFKSKDYQLSGVPIVKVSDFTDNSIDTSRLVFVSELVARSSSSVTLNAGDIIIATVGSWPNNPASVVGKTVRVPLNAAGALLNQNAVALRSKTDDSTEQAYIYYCLKSPNFINYLVGGAQGSANQASITLSNIFRFKINDFNLRTKSNIVDILSSIDDKIELNRKMNETMEQMGQALFRHHFINNTEAKLVDLESIALLERGVEPGSKNYKDSLEVNTVPFLRVGDLSQRSGNLFVDVNLCKNKIARSDDVLVSFDGAPGLVGTGLEGCFSSGIRKVSPKVDFVSKAYLYFLMKTEEVQNVIDRYAEGTTIKHASKSISHIKAPITTAADKAEMLDHIFEQTIINLGQIKLLTTLRDTLLPRLISGKIKVR